MLSTFRAIAKSKFTLVILGVPLIAGLLVFGNVRDVFNNMSVRDSVVSAGSRVVGSQEFKRLFDDAKADAEKQAGRPITVEEAVSKGALEGILKNLAEREGFMAALEKAGLRPSDKLLVEQIRKIPAFFNPVTGQFDQKLYEHKLAERGLTPATFERSGRDGLAQQYFSYAIADGIKAPQIYSAMVAALVTEQRSFSAFGLDPRSVPVPPTPSDAVLNAFIKAHASQMMLPETRALSVVRFSAKALAPTLSVDPAEVQKRFDFRKDTLSTPERRTVVQIPAKDAAAAASVVARLNAGQSAQQVAASMGVDPITYSDAPRTAISDARVAEAAFSTAVGKVSAPVQGALGWAVVKVTGMTPGRAVTLDEARPAIEAELKGEAAEDKIYDLVQKYDDAHSGGSSLKEAAKAAGVAPLDLPPVTAQGVDLKGKPQPQLSEKLLKQAFDLPEGGESDVVDEGKGEYFAVRVDKVFPAALRALDTDRQELTTFYLQTQVAQALQARADALAAQVRKGQSMPMAAAAAGARLQSLTLTRQQADSDQTQRRELFAQVFAANQGDVITAGPVIIRVDAVRAAPIDQVAHLTRIGQQQMTGSILQDMLGPEPLGWARKTMKVKVDPARARAALGLAPVQDDSKVNGPNDKPAPGK